MRPSIANTERGSDDESSRNDVGVGAKLIDGTKLSDGASERDGTADAADGLEVRDGGPPLT
jgi:hypothetical protein